MLMRIIKKICPRTVSVSLCIALIQVQKDVCEVNDDISRWGWAYNTNLFSICTLNGLISFFSCQDVFSHPIMQLSSLCTPQHLPHIYTSVHLFFVFPHLPFFCWMTSDITPVLSSQEKWNTIQLWCFNTTLNCDNDFITELQQSQMCCTSIPCTLLNVVLSLAAVEIR